MKRSLLLIAMIAVLICLTGCALPDYLRVFLTEAPQRQEQAAENEPALPSRTSPPETEPGSTEIMTAEPDDEDFVRIADYVPNAKAKLAYATTDNFTGTRIYDFTEPYLRYGTAKKLAKVGKEMEARGLGLVIWDGFRPTAAQAKLWELCPDPAFVSHPVTGKRTHCRGNTVDVTLYDLDTGKLLNMPTGYDNFTDYADRDYSDCSEEAAEHAELLESVMEAHGFVPYYAEWWHFSDEEDYPVDEAFDPAVPMEWAANCKEYISLRETPGGEVMQKIPKDDRMQLLQWEGKYAKVLYQETEGYVLSSYIMPRDEHFFKKALDIVTPTDVYTYEQMMEDLHALEERHSGQLTVDCIGYSELGRAIPVMRIGKEDATHHVLIQGAIHGREHMTAWLLMAIADYWTDHGLAGYGDICWHILPMSNPDGVAIAQSGKLDEMQRQIFAADTKAGYTQEEEAQYAVRWKANAKGVDVNRNFPAGWEEIDERANPSSQQYRGTAPFSTAEAAALRDYTLRYAFDTTISYHATGSVLYWEYGDKEGVNERSRSLAEAVREISGYALADSSTTDGAGYKDWAMDALEIPSLTVEIGCEEAALAQREIYSIFVRNYRILPAIARWIQMQ